VQSVVVVVVYDTFYYYNCLGTTHTVDKKMIIFFRKKLESLDNNHKACDLIVQVRKQKTRKWLFSCLKDWFLLFMQTKRLFL
jgi:predicted RNA-binding protein